MSVKDLKPLLFSGRTRLAAVLLGAVVLSSCSMPATHESKNVRSSTTGPAGTRALVGVNSLVVIPPAMDRGAVADAKALYRSLEGIAKRELQMEVTSGESVLRLSDPSGGGAHASAANIGRRVGADSVLVTQVHSLSERDGSALGVNAPASVSFTMRVVRSADGVEVWRDTFSYRDKAASEDILGAARRLQEDGSLGWRSATATLEAGFVSTLRKLNDARLSQFTAN